jgi:hypothetical protein
MRLGPKVTAFVAVSPLAACVSTSFQEGTFACDPVAAPSCPPGLVCASDGRCRSSADGGLDATAPADGGSDARDAAVLVGDPRAGSASDQVDPGHGIAFPFVANASGAVGRLFVLIDVTNRAATVEIGLYDTYFDHPGQRLAVADIQDPKPGWSSVAVSPAAVSASETYWLALFSKTPGTPVVFDADPLSSDVHGEYTIESDLTELPARWNSGVTFSRLPACAYATAP